jgi:MFS family permease
MQSVCTSWAGLMVCRFFLGITEAMFGPGVGLYLAYFYPREKLGFRLGVFISGSALANAYGSALAYGISHINSSIGNWQFLFIIEGVPSCLLGLITWFFIPDSPGTCRFLNEREKKIATAIAHQQPGDFEYEGLNIKQFFSAGMDYRSYFTALMYFGCNVSFASLPLFLPTIVSELGEFTEIESNGLSAPPYLACFFTIIIASILSDRMGVRGPFVVFFGLVSAVGFLLLGVTTGTGPRYFALFLAVNSFVCVALILPWVANNNSTDSNRTGGYWILQTIGQCGPLLGTNVFPAKDAPFYQRGSFISMAFSLLVAALAAILVFLLWRENRRRDKKYGRIQDAHIEIGADANEDRNFRYVL